MIKPYQFEPIACSDSVKSDTKVEDDDSGDTERIHSKDW